jgi:hypothetical protein
MNKNIIKNPLHGAGGILRSILFLILFPSLVFSQSIFDITKYGAKGDGKTVNTKAIQQAIDECSKAGGGTVLFPKGEFVTGTLIMKNDVNIYLSHNAILKGSGNLSDYPNIEIGIDSRIENIIGSTKKQLLFAENVSNIGITGEGTFNPNGEAFRDGIDESPNRPYGLRFVKCNNVTMSNIHMRNSAYWMQRYMECDHLRLTGLKVWNHCNLNNDGMDIDGCHDVIVSDCFVDSSDDGICLKAESNRSCEDVVVTNCVVSSFASGLKLGTGSLGGFRRVAFSNCVVRPTKAKEMSHNTGSWGGLAGIDILEVDGAFTEYVNFNNIVIDSSDCAIFIKMGNRNGIVKNGDPRLKNSILKNISLSNIQAKNSGPISCAITGFPGSYVENISLSNIQIHTRGEGTDRDTTLQIMENSAGYPSSGMFASNLPSYGLYVRHVKNIQLSNVRFTTGKSEQRPALVMDDVKNIMLDNVQVELTSTSEGIEAVNLKRIPVNEIKVNRVFITETENRKVKSATAIQKTKLPDLDSALILSLTFNKLDNGSVTDLSSAKLISKVTKAKLTEGKKNKAIQFTEGAYLDFESPKALNISGEITVAFWMKVIDNQANKYYRVFAKRKSWNDPTGFEMEINPGLNRMNFSGGSTGTKNQGLVTLSFDGFWHYYVAVIKDSRLRVYVDGQLKGWDDNVTMPTPTDVSFVIGANSFGKDNFEGALDEFKLWNRALSEQEIKAISK